MFETESELRIIATKIVSIAATASLAAGLFGGFGAAPALASSASPKLPATVSFLKASFNASDIETRMTTGFAIEALIQLAGAGVSSTDLSSGIRAEFTRANRALGTSGKPGFLVDPGTLGIKPGLAGKFLYASKVLKINNAGLERTVFELLNKQIAADGAVAASKGNAQDVAWVALGLTAYRKLAAARQVAAALIKMQHSDGGFNYDPTITTGGTDVTAIAIQALKSVPLANKARSTKRNQVVATAVAFLKNTAVGGDHFEAWGDVDPNGTAYAIMGLQSAGVDASNFAAWLKSHLQSDGGVDAPWALGVGDRFVTAQAYLPLIGKNYVSLALGK